jgi:hypothetical protein
LRKAENIPRVSGIRIKLHRKLEETRRDTRSIRNWMQIKYTKVIININ